MALSKQEIKEVMKIVNNIKNSGMNPWGNWMRGKEMNLSHLATTRKKKTIFNKEDVSQQPDKEKFKKKP
jgi:hypothetical protein